MLRQLTKGNLTVVCSSFNAEFSSVVSSLSSARRKKFEALKKKFFDNQKKEGKRQRLCKQIEKKPTFTWNLTKVNQLSDDQLKEVILHQSGYSVNPLIEQAIQFGTSYENKELQRVFGYHVYAGVTPRSLQKDFGIPEKLCTWIIALFFDFSKAPKGVLAKPAYLRQLVVNRIIEEQDFHAYKRITDLGIEGLLSLDGIHHLDKKGKTKIQEYLRSSVLGQALNMRFKARTFQEARQVAEAVMMVTDLKAGMKQLELADARIRLTEADVEKTKAVTAGMTTGSGLQSKDEEIIQYIQTYRDKEPAVQTFKMIKDLQNPG